jgi:serine/threonine protein kinase
VYKGVLPDGKPIAVKVLKSSKEAWKDFAFEVEIISSLKHKNITQLLGICIEDNTLISVFMPLVGVVLLELISCRELISSESCKGKESLVAWLRANSN